MSGFKAPKPRALTDTYLKTLKPDPRPGKRYAVSDTTCPGLKVRVNDKGKGHFILWRRLPGAKHPSALSLGEVGTVTLTQAREKARTWLAQIKQGDSPKKIEAKLAEDKRRAAAEEVAKAEATFGKAVRDRYFPTIERLCDKKKIKQVFEHDLLPGWENRPVLEISRKEIKQRLRTIARRTTSQAFTAGGYLITFYNWLREEDDIEGGVPTDAMKLTKVLGQSRKFRERVLSDDELFAFWDAVNPQRWEKRIEKGQRLIRGKMQNVSTICPDRTVMAQGCRVLLLTGARLNEIFESDRRELSANGTVLAVPPERFKSGSTHMIQLPVMAQGIIESLPHKGSLLFSYDGKKPARVWSKDRERIRDLMLATLKDLARQRGENPDLVTLEDFTLHDLRRSVRTGLSRLRVPREVAELVVGHDKRGLERIYNQHSYALEIREALEAWSALLMRIITKPATAEIREIAQERASKGKKLPRVG